MINSHESWWNSSDNVEFGCRNHKTKTIITIKNACEIPHNLHLMQIKVLKTEYNNKVSSMHLLSHLHQQCIALQSLPQPHKFSESSSYTGRFHCKTHAIGLFREEKSISLFFFPGKNAFFTSITHYQYVPPDLFQWDF